jgi:hypothetical protein
MDRRVWPWRRCGRCSACYAAPPWVTVCLTCGARQQQSTVLPLGLGLWTGWGEGPNREQIIVVEAGGSV